MGKNEQPSQKKPNNNSEYIGAHSEDWEYHLVEMTNVAKKSFPRYAHKRAYMEVYVGKKGKRGAKMSPLHCYIRWEGNKGKQRWHKSHFVIL